MKRIILGFFLITGLYLPSIYAQSRLAYSEVIEVENSSMSDLYIRANSWFETTYKKEEKVLQLADTAKGQLEGKAMMKFSPTVYTRSDETKGSIRYSIKVYVKDNRYKYELSNFNHNPDGIRYGTYSAGIITNEDSNPRAKSETKVWSDKVWQDIKHKIDKESKTIIESLKNAMANPPLPENTDTMGDDW